MTLRECQQVFHQLQLFGDVVMDYDRLRGVLSAIYEWSYAHRAGNGELSDEEQREMVDKAWARVLVAANVRGD